MNNELLKYVIVRQGLTQEKVASALGFSRQSLIKRLDGVIDFRLSEIRKIEDICSLTPAETRDIFFN